MKWVYRCCSRSSQIPMALCTTAECDDSRSATNGEAGPAEMLQGPFWVDHTLSHSLNLLAYEGAGFIKIGPCTRTYRSEQIDGANAEIENFRSRNLSVTQVWVRSFVLKLFSQSKQTVIRTLLQPKPIAKRTLLQPNPTAKRTLLQPKSTTRRFFEHRLPPQDRSKRLTFHRPTVQWYTCTN